MPAFFRKLLGNLDHRDAPLDRFLSPILSLFQGIPALSWVVFAIIWFHGVEFRIFFIMVIMMLPACTFQVLGALARECPGTCMEMVFSFPVYATEICSLGQRRSRRRVPGRTS